MKFTQPLFSLLCALCAFCGSTISAAEKSNVLFIMCDDLNDYIVVLGGHPEAKTPNIDRLFKSGVTFTQALCNVPICAPSRSSLFTGLYPHTSANFGFANWDANPVLKNNRTVMDHFRANGYQTMGTGKLMHNRDRTEWQQYGNPVDYGPLVKQGEKEYGTYTGSDLKREYAKNCVLARRLIEKGVRVVQLFNGSAPSGGNGITNGDSHSDIKDTHSMQAEIIDQPTAALIRDMKRRGLLDDTLIVWCTEFGRMPFLQGNGTGRDHSPSAFTCFLAGAGVKKGFSYGESDEFGFKAALNETSVYGFNATILHLMGLDHERLTFYHNGLERRLTNVHGHVIKDELA